MHRSLLPLLMALVPVCTLAEEVAHIGIELNATESDGQACTLTFVIENGLLTPIDVLVTETVLFTAAEQVERLTLFDFGALPAARRRVRQFAVEGLACDDLGQILFNGTERCEGGDLTLETCDAALRASTRTSIEVLR